ncbi:MAG: sigma-70 family RNA polymerase sigma factor [Oligoflexales bacterium]|nr:sigma-70 family RNA polymerase sigma factor [Oligoflexales bacterium]
MKNLNSVFSYLDDESIQRISDKNRLNAYLSNEKDTDKIDSAVRESLDKKMYSYLRNSLSKLTEQQRELIHLRFWNSLTSTEISKILGISEDEFFKTLNISLDKLRKDLVITLFNRAKPNNGTYL